MTQTSTGRHYKESRKQKTALPNTAGNQKQRRSNFENVPTHIHLLWHDGDPDAKGLMRKAWWEKQAAAQSRSEQVEAECFKALTLLTLTCKGFRKTLKSLFHCSTVAFYIRTVSFTPFFFFHSFSTFQQIYKKGTVALWLATQDRRRGQHTRTTLPVSSPGLHTSY